MLLPKSAICIALFLFVTMASLSAQTITDTFYYDNHQSFCEPQVAYEYRVGTLVMQPFFHYEGEVKDFYINGTPAMTGAYDTAGYKTGVFIFYYANGNIKKQGSFVKNEMSGLWSYYDSTGKLRVQLQCAPGTAFSPVLLVKKDGETVLKDGTGKFIFNPHDYKDLSLGIIDDEWFMNGEVKQNKREGDFFYTHLNSDEKTPFAKETYRDGKFIRAKMLSYYTEVVNKPLWQNNLKTVETANTEQFSHSNIVFQNNDEALIRYLMSKQIPLLNTRSASFTQNISSINFVIKDVFSELLFRLHR